MNEPSSIERLRGKDLVADFHPNAGKRLLVFLGGSDGGLPVIGERLAAYCRANYQVLELAYFGIEGLPATLKSIRIEYLVDAIRSFLTRLELSDQDLVLVGSSKGGELVLLLVSRFLKPAVAVASVPSCFAFQAIPRGLLDIIRPRSSWSWQGKDLPYLKMTINRATMRDIRRQHYTSCYEQSIDFDQPGVSYLDVSAYEGHMLLLSATTDHFWPSRRMCELVVSRRRDRSRIRHRNLDIEGHMFLQYDQSSQAIIDFLAESGQTAT